VLRRTAGRPASAGRANDGKGMPATGHRVPGVGAGGGPWYVHVYVLEYVHVYDGTNMVPWYHGTMVPWYTCTLPAGSFMVPWYGIEYSAKAAGEARCRGLCGGGRLRSGIRSQPASQSVSQPGHQLSQLSQLHSTHPCQLSQ
jgi:hypothetical protein